MRIRSLSRTRSFVLALVALSGLFLLASPSFASPPPPNNPILNPTQPPPSPPAGIVATPSQWNGAAAIVLSLYPDIDWSEFLTEMLDMFDLLPPVGYTPPWEAMIPGSPTYP